MLAKPGLHCMRRKQFDIHQIPKCMGLLTWVLGHAVLPTLADEQAWESVQLLSG